MQPPNGHGAIAVASLPKPPEEPAEPIAAKPPNPKREERKEVPVTPPAHRPVTDRATLLKMVGRIGPAHSWEDIELADKAGTIRQPNAKGKGGAHVLGVTLRDENGQTVARWNEVSLLNVGFPGAKKLGHTEQQALVRILLGGVQIGDQLIAFQVKPGWRVIFNGQHTPCTYKDGCSMHMDHAAQSLGLDIQYSDMKTDHEFSTEGRKTKAFKKATRFNL